MFFFLLPYVIMLRHIGHKKIIIETFSGLVVLDIEFWISNFRYWISNDLSWLS